MEYEGDGDTNSYWCTLNNPQKARGVENQGMIEDHLNYSIVEVNQNHLEESWRPERLAVTQYPLKDHQLME